MQKRIFYVQSNNRNNLKNLKQYYHSLKNIYNKEHSDNKISNNEFRVNYTEKIIQGSHSTLKEI